MATAFEIARDILVAWISSEKMVPITGGSNEEIATAIGQAFKKIYKAVSEPDK
jgi:hypothetical protein